VESAEIESTEGKKLEPAGRMPAEAFTEDRPVPLLIEPDLAFIRTIQGLGGETFKKCFQCGTCSATCPISPREDPFPRKEMAWAAWGMRGRLLRDPDIWLCHQCNDCSVRCPRTGRPGDVMAAIRRESIIEYSVPRFLARAVNSPGWAPVLLAIPAVLLGLAVGFRESIGNALGFLPSAGNRIAFAYSSMIPQWLIMIFFGFFTLLAIVALTAGLVRFWKGLKNGGQDGQEPVKGLAASLFSVAVSILKHEHFSSCEAARPRYVSHMGMMFGFLALTLVTIWVMTARINPLITSDFVYPFNFWNPWRILANLGGLALLGGCLWMVLERLEESDGSGRSTYFDWAFLGVLSLVVVTGFISEMMHYLRLVPHRHVVYFIHLVLVFNLVIYLPYSKFAHIFYRTVAMVFAESRGRQWGAAATTEDGVDSQVH